MREDDDVRVLHDQEIICLYVDEGPVPGIHDDMRHAGVRISIEDALAVVDHLKHQIRNALEKR
jgi:hypothetical protein